MKPHVLGAGGGISKNKFADLVSTSGYGAAVVHLIAAFLGDTPTKSVADG